VRELRVAFHQQLQEIDREVSGIFTMVAEDLRLATESLLSGDGEVLAIVTEREERIDALYEELERLANEQLALQGPVADELRLLLSVLRVVPELERSHDLVVSIAGQATHSLHDSLSPRTKGLVQRMSDTGVGMWRDAQVAWEQRNHQAADELIDRDEEMDSLHAALIAELASGVMSVPVTMDMTLVARFYERLGDHAVNVARRVRFLAGLD